MIGQLTGQVGYVAEDHVLIDVAGVGYIVHVSERTRADLPGPGEAVRLFTDLLVREDLMQLFGFTSLAEKEWHRLLMGVQGIGAKASLAILGALGPDGVARAIVTGDAGAIRRAQGVGPKIATRVVTELKDRAPAMIALGGQGGGATSERTVPPATAAAAAPPGPGAAAPAPGAEDEALSALVNLGYAPSDAARAVSEAADEGAADTAALIRAALRRLAPGA